MRKTFLIQLVFACFALLLSQADGYGQKKEKTGVKKLHLLPVYLIYSGLPYDTAINRIVWEAFTRHNVKVITLAEFNQANQNEVLRVETKFRARGNEFGSEREVREAIAKEQRFATNWLHIEFNTRTSGDSLTVSGASWEATAYPPGISSARSSGYIKTELDNTCCSPQDNLFAIIDKILMSKWLR